MGGKEQQECTNFAECHGPLFARKRGVYLLAFTGLDEKVSVPTAEIREREQRDLREVRKQLEGRFASEPDPLVKQDLTILIGNINHDLRNSEVEQRLLLPYSNVARTIFFGIRSLLDDRWNLSAGRLRL